jgi:hypothetical protein
MRILVRTMEAFDLNGDMDETYGGITSALGFHEMPEGDYSK